MPPWKYERRVLARDFGNHLVHGLSVAAAHRALDVVFDRR